MLESIEFIFRLALKLEYKPFFFYVPTGKNYRSKKDDCMEMDRYFSYRTLYQSMIRGMITMRAEEVFTF